ncbi:MAG: YbhN family protein [Gemmatimonadota bacterium]
MKRPALRWLFQIVVSASLLALVFFVVDLRSTFSELRRASLGWLVFGLAITVLSRFIMAYKWNLLMRAKGMRIRLVEVFRLYYVASFLGLLLPATVGMDFVRAMFLKREDRPLPDILSSIIVERLIGFVMLSLVALAGAIGLVGLLLDTDVPLWTVLGLPAGLLIVALAVIGFSATDRARSAVQALTEWIGARKRLARSAGHLQKLYDSYWGYRSHRHTLVVFSALTLVEIVTLMAWNYAGIRAMGIDLSFARFVLIIPVITLLVRLPITVAGLGVVEGAYVFFLSILGVPTDLALAAGLLVHALSTVAVLPGALVYRLSPRYRSGAKAIARDRPPGGADPGPI